MAQKGRPSRTNEAQGSPQINKINDQVYFFMQKIQCLENSICLQNLVERWNQARSFWGWIFALYVEQLSIPYTSGWQEMIGN